MLVSDIKAKKEQNESLNSEEIEFIVKGYLTGNVSDLDMETFLKAVVKFGMSDDETIFLTHIMENSGEKIDLSGEKGIFVDKHSSGGVSDTTTLIVAPIIATLGLKMIKMSGRSLGYTGGTIDKLEVFKGYDTGISVESAKKIADKFGASIISQSESLVPADKKIYALRDKTGTVSSIPLIASSIMSKKLASGAGVILLDVKFGAGALLEKKKDAIVLAKLMVRIGKTAGRKMIAIVTNMNSPLGRSVGDSLEVAEAQRILLGEKSNLSKLAIYICALLLQSAKGKSLPYWKKKIGEVIKNKSAYGKLSQIVRAHGGVFENVNDRFAKLEKFEIESRGKGFINRIDTKKLGEIVHAMRKKHGGDAGFVLNKNYGDYVRVGDTLFSVYLGDKEDRANLASAFGFSVIKPIGYRLISKIIR